MTMSVTRTISLFAAGLGVAAMTMAGCEEDRKPPGGPAPPTSTATTSNQGGGDEGGGGQAGGAQGGQGGQGGLTPTDEDCYDGVDNDLNDKIDCIDPDPACTEVCGDACAAPAELADPTEQITGSNASHAKLGGSSCSAAQGSGPANVYKFVSNNDGMIDVTLQSKTGDHTLSIRTDCATASTEQACSERAVTDETPPFFEYLSVTTKANDVAYIVVEGYSTIDEGSYLLSAKSRIIECGDAIIDADEECDDGNTQANDGCSNLCDLEATETEPNDTIGTADPWSESWFAKIDPNSDIDFISIVIPAGKDSVKVSITDLGNGGCSYGFLDPYVKLYDSQPQLIAEKDDGGDTYCTELKKTALSAGTYYAAISDAESSKGQSTFVYAVFVEFGKCGDGSEEGGEECDDGNTMSGDGCSSTCEQEGS